MSDEDLEKKYYLTLKEIYELYQKRQEEPENKELYDRIKELLEQLQELLLKNKIPNLPFPRSFFFVMDIYRLNESLLYRLKKKNDFKK